MPKVVLAGSNGLPYPTLKEISETRADVVLFGDSVMERVSRHDEDRRTLGQMVTARLAPQSVLTLSRSAHNPDIYLPLLRAMKKVRHRSECIIIPVNMRCFSPQWELSPDWTFDQEKEIIKRFLWWPWFAIPAVKDVALDSAKHEAFGRMPVFFELSHFQTIGEFKQVIASPPSFERSRTIFTYHYTHRLSPYNLRLKNLLKALKVARSLARNVMVYVTPINKDALEKFVGHRGVEIVSENVETLRSAVGTYALHDWSTELPEDRFFSEDLATEHLNERGRSELADMIASKL